MFRVSVSSPLLGGFGEPETLCYKVNSYVPKALRADSREEMSPGQFHFGAAEC